MTNLDAIESDKYMGFVLPLPIQYGDASPVRMVAIHKEGLKQLIDREFLCAVSAYAA